MLEFRLKSLETFNKMAMQEWGPDLSGINFDDLTYFQRHQINLLVTGKMFLRKLRKLLNVLVSQKQSVLILLGASAQYESEVVYHNMKEEYDKLGIIFTDTDSALKEHPELFKRYFSN